MRVFYTVCFSLLLLTACGQDDGASPTTRDRDGVDTEASDGASDAGDTSGGILPDLLGDLTSSGMDTSSSGVDTSSSGVDTSSSGMDTSSSGMDTSSSGMDTSSSGVDTSSGGAAPMDGLFTSRVNEVVIEVDYEEGAAPYTRGSLGFGQPWDLFIVNAEAIFRRRRAR